MGAGTERVRLAYGRSKQRATGGSYFAYVTTVATAKRSKADSATAKVMIRENEKQEVECYKEQNDEVLRRNAQ